MNLYKSGTLPDGILLSNAWCEGADVKIVWITMLALARDVGEPVSPVWKSVIFGTVPRIAHLAGVTPAVAEIAIERLTELGMIKRSEGEGWYVLHGAEV